MSLRNLNAGIPRQPKNYPRKIPGKTRATRATRAPDPRRRSRAGHRRPAA